MSFFEQMYRCLYK